MQKYGSHPNIRPHSYVRSHAIVPPSVPRTCTSIGPTQLYQYWSHAVSAFIGPTQLNLHRPLFLAWSAFSLTGSVIASGGQHAWVLVVLRNCSYRAITELCFQGGRDLFGQMAESQVTANNAGCMRTIRQQHSTLPVQVGHVLRSFPARAISLGVSSASLRYQGDVCGITEAASYTTNLGESVYHYQAS